MFIYSPMGPIIPKSQLDTIETAVTDAEAAQLAAETAQGLAETAELGAQTAQGLAEDAQDAAEAAAAVSFRGINKSVSGSLSAADMISTLLGSLGQTTDITLTMDPAASGLHGRICLSTTVAKFFRLDPNASDYIIFDGQVLAAGKYVGVASAVAGNSIDYHAFESATGVYDWIFNAVSGNWVAEA